VISRARRTGATALAVALLLPSAAAAELRIVAAEGLPADPARDAAWHRFFGALPHGAELDSLIAVLAPPSEVARRCGARADGCYHGALRQMVIPGVGGPGDAYLADIARHEYGHHLAAMSDNAPFDPWLGTKRWFTHERICVRLRAGELVAGSSGPYERSAAEGFAEAYRVVAGGSSHRWIVVPEIFPDSGARRAILADVRRPWRGGRTRRYSGRLSAQRPVRELRLPIPLDGTVRVVATGSGSLRPVMTLSDGSRVLARGSRLRHVACGQRTLRLTVRARRGAGRFRVITTTP
jgi:hypothetical protein